jgi:hypothetical protein
MKSLILKIRKLVEEHPTLVTIGLSLAISFAIGAAIGILDSQQAYAGPIIIGEGRSGP